MLVHTTSAILVARRWPLGGLGTLLLRAQSLVLSVVQFGRGPQPTRKSRTALPYWYSLVGKRPSLSFCVRPFAIEAPQYR